jgi:predicted porin
MKVQPGCRCFAAGVLAMFAAGAQAQSSLTLFGLMDLSVGRFQAPGADATQGVESGSMTTSFWGVKGTEDLGGGLGALFAAESFLRGDTGAAGRFGADTFWARSVYVGLSSKDWGTVTLGRNTTSLFVQTLLFNAFGDSFGFSPSIRHTFTSGTVTGDTGWSDSVKYTSPRFGGFSFTTHAAANDEGAGSGRNGGASVLYFSGPLALGGAWQRVRKGTADDTTAWQVGGSWAIGTSKLFAQYGAVDNDTTGNEFKVTGLGGSLGLGAGSLLAQWGRISPQTGADRTTFSFGYDHYLSKRTDVYAVYMNDKIDGLSSGGSWAAGIRHRF